MRARHPLFAATMACLIATGCGPRGGPVVPVATKKPGATKPAGASPKPLPPGSGLLGLDGLARVPLPADAAIATLTGKAKLLAPASLVSNNGGSLISDKGGSIISDNGGGLIAGAKGAIISDNGGGIISNNSGAILSNNGGGVVANNGGGVLANNGGSLVSNNGGSLTGKGKYGLAQAPAQVAGFALAEATITFHDATGAVLVDAKNQPLTATTDRTGAYTYTGPLPKGNVVARIKLNPAVGRGELQAMVARDSAGSLALDLDTASTIGAAYVLGNFVKGQQAVFDKLPRAANEKLQRELDVVRGYLVGAFAYDPKLLVEAADALRTREATVDTTIDEVKALLLGQASIGAGRPATEVPLGDPHGLFVDREGALLIGEFLQGRIRRLKDGRLETILDAAFGRVKKNLIGLADLVEAPDGTLYVSSYRANQVYKITPDGRVTPCLGTGLVGRSEPGDPLRMDIVPYALALGPDGTLYVGEGRGSATSRTIPPRLLALSPAGVVSEVPLDPLLTGGGMQGLALGPDGALYVLYHDSRGVDGRIYRRRGAELVRVAEGLRTGENSELALGPDGTLYYSEETAGHVMAIAPAGGAPRPIAGPGVAGPAGTLSTPGPLGMGPDGTLYVADRTTNLVWAFGPAGAVPQVIAGTQAAVQAGDVTTFAINTPGGVAFDEQGRLLIAEGGSHTIKRFDGKTLTIVAGSVRGDAGDGGPALAALLDQPTGLAYAAGTIYVLENENRTLRAIDAAGTIRRLAGQRGGEEFPPLGGPGHPALQTDVSGSFGLAIAPDGRPYWTNAKRKKLQRLAGPADAPVVQAIAGRNVGGDTGSESLLSALFTANPDEPDPLQAILPMSFGVAFDARGDAFVADMAMMAVFRLTGLADGPIRLQRVAGIGAPKTLAIAAEAGPDGKLPDGDGGPALAAPLLLPTGLAFDRAGNLYVAEGGSSNTTSLSELLGQQLPFDPAVLPKVAARIRKIAPDGTITTVAGPGTRWFADPASEDALAMPTALAIAPDGRLAIADSGANLVRVLPAGAF